MSNYQIRKDRDISEERFSIIWIFIFRIKWYVYTLLELNNATYGLTVKIWKDRYLSDRF